MAAKLLTILNIYRVAFPSELPDAIKSQLIEENNLSDGDLVAFEKNKELHLSVCKDNDIISLQRVNQEWVIPSIFKVGDDYFPYHWWFIENTKFNETKVWIDVEKYGKELLYNYDKTEKITHFSAKLGTFFIEVNPNYENLFMFILEHNGDLLVEVNKYYPNEDTMYFPYHPDDY